MKFRFPRGKEGLRRPSPKATKRKDVRKTRRARLWKGRSSRGRGKREGRHLIRLKGTASSISPLLRNAFSESRRAPLKTASEDRKKSRKRRSLKIRGKPPPRESRRIFRKRGKTPRRQKGISRTPIRAGVSPFKTPREGTPHWRVRRRFPGIRNSPPTKGNERTPNRAGPRNRYSV